MPLNRQLVFDTAVAGLYKQGRSSMREDGETCAYRGENGTMCAVGFCIPGNRYKAEFEGKAADADEVLEMVGAKFGVADTRASWEGGNGDKEFLLAMQDQLHDGIELKLTPSKFRRALRGRARKFAKQHGLKVDVNLFNTE